MMGGTCWRRIWFRSADIHPLILGGKDEKISIIVLISMGKFITAIGRFKSANYRLRIRIRNQQRKIILSDTK